MLAYGDFPEGFMEQQEHLRLFTRCLDAYEQLEDLYLLAPEHDEVSGMSCRIADRLAKRTGGHVELAYLGLRRPGLREALYHTVSAGSMTTVFVGGAGLIVPGYTSLVQLPYTLRRTAAENAGLDIIYTLPGINVGIAAELIKASVENVLRGCCMPLQPAGEVPAQREDLGVVVVSAPDPGPVLSTSSRAAASYTTAAKALSDASRASAGVQAGGITWLMEGVMAYLRKSGLFSEVATGYIDFSRPGPEDALRMLEASGCRQVLVTAAPSLLHRHGFSWETPDSVVERLQQIAGPDLVYLAPDTSALTGWALPVVETKVAGAEFAGISLKGSGRK